MIDATLLAKLDRAVFRYPSHPTAPHVSPNVAVAAGGAWLAAIPSARPLSLYVQVLFYDQLCFCSGDNTAVVRRDVLEWLVTSCAFRTPPSDLGCFSKTLTQGK